MKKSLLTSLLAGLAVSVTATDTQTVLSAERPANNRYAATTPLPVLTEPKTPIRLVADSRAVTNPAEILQAAPLPVVAPVVPNPPKTAEVMSPPTVAHVLSTLPQGESINLATIRDEAIRCNPAYAQVYRQRQALRGDWVQAGLKENPSIGYAGEEMTKDYAGKQGIEFGQTFVPKKKRAARQEAVRQEIGAAAWRVDAQRQRIVNDALLAGCRVAIAERKLMLLRDLLQIDLRAFEANSALLKGQEISRADYLESKIQLGRTRIALGDAEIEYRTSCRELALLLGRSTETLFHLEDAIDQIPAELAEEHLWAEIMACSSELREARAGVAAARARLQREIAEAGLDFDTAAAVLWNTETRETQVSVGFAIPLKIHDRNQGNIQRAKSELAAAGDNVRRMEMLLSQRFQKSFAAYRTARSRVVAYEAEILAEAQESHKIAADAHRQGEYGSLELLMTQQTLYNVKIEHLNSLGELWAAQILLEGSLLADGLEVAD